MERGGEPSQDPLNAPDQGESTALCEHCVMECGG